MRYKNVFLAIWAGVGSVIVRELGGWDGMLKALLVFMAIDYATGLMVAAFWHKSNKSKSGALDSRAGFKGLCRKGMILMFVWVGVLLDNALGTANARDAIILFYIGNEVLSIAENAGLMGIDYPPVIKKALEALQDQDEEEKE